MRKSFILSFLLALLTTFALPAKTLEVPLNSATVGDRIGKKGYDPLRTFSYNDVSFGISNLIPSANNVQGRANSTGTDNFYLYNTTALPNITKVEITVTAGSKFTAPNAAATKVYTAESTLSSAPSSDGVSGTLSNNVITYDLSDAPGSYFHFAVPTNIGGSRYYTTLTITYDEGGSVETAPDAPTFSVASGEVDAGTEVTVTSKGATSLEISAKVGDAADFTTSTVSGNTYTFTVNENTEIKAVGINDAGRSEEASAAYTVKVVVPTAPATPTFSVAAGEVSKGTEVTVTSADATSLEISTKVGDAADFTTSTVTGNTYTFTVNEATEIKAVGINDAGRSDEATATYTIKEVVPGSEETYTVTFSNYSKDDLAYGKGKTIIWEADADPSITFETSATSASTQYPQLSGTDLGVYLKSNKGKAHNNVVTVTAPAGYKFSKVAAIYTKNAVLIDDVEYASEAYKEFDTPVASFTLKSAEGSENRCAVSAMNLVLVADGPVVPVAPTAVTVTPSKTDAKVGETVSITLSADGTPAPKIYYTTDGTTPTETSQEYKGTFDITCDEIAGDATEAVIRVTALAVNATGSVTSAVDVKYTRNEASVTVKDPSGNVVTGDMTMVLEDGAKTFTAETNSDVKVTWMSSDYGTLDISEDGVFTPRRLGKVIVVARVEQNGKYTVAEKVFNLTVTSPNTYATVIFRNQTPFTYGSGTINWISEPVDGKTYTFATKASGYVTAPTNTDEDEGTATNLTIAKEDNAAISIDAPEGYAFVRVTYITPTMGSAVAAIDGEDLALDTYRDYPAGASTITLAAASTITTSAKLGSMTFALTKAVKPTALTIKPNKTEAVAGQTVSVKIEADAEAFPAPTIYYTRDGSTPVVGGDNTQVYDPEKGFTLQRSVPQTVVINAIAVNCAGTVAAEPVEIVFKDKDHVAPVAISFSEAEGARPAGTTLNVRLTADDNAYPVPTIYYTLDGYMAQGEHGIEYNAEQGIDIAKPANGNVVTINAYAVNDAGGVIDAATYTFPNEGETSLAQGWVRINDAADLQDGLEVVVAYATTETSGNTTDMKLMTSTKTTNGGLASADVTLDNTYNVLVGTFDDAERVFLEGNATDGWYMRLTDGTYITPKYNKSKKEYENGLDFAATKDAALPATIDLTQGNAYVTFNGTDREFVYNDQGRRFAAYNIIADTQRRPIDFFCMGEYYKAPDYEDLYLVMKSNEVDGKEVAIPFNYEGEGYYRLSVTDLQGTFYIRDGKANHGGTYFGASVDECIDPETATGYVGHSIDATATAIAGEPTPGVKNADGKDLYAYVGKNGSTEFTLVYDPADTEHYVFSTHPNSNIHHVARIDSANLTVIYTPGSRTNAKLQVELLGTTGVEDIDAEGTDAEVRYYNLQGVRVDNPAAGIYIRVAGNTATKVYVK